MTELHPSLDAAFDPVFALVMSLPQLRPAPNLPRRLESLFRQLAKPEPDRDPDEIEELIWALWIGHEEAAASASMAAAVEAMTAGEPALAASILDQLVTDYPDWAEAWNKRATLAFIAERDEESVADIARTLHLEPRHFGAISGFAQICLRRGRLREARAAFQAALAINPHLQGVSDVIDELAQAAEPLH